MVNIKSKNDSNRFSLKKELTLLPGYIIVLIWVAFTVAMVSWVFLASLSTTRGIFSDNLFAYGVHFENYANALFKSKLGLYAMNSIIYTSASVFGMIIIAAPAAYVLSRFKFRGSKFILSLFVIALSVPGIIVTLPLFFMAAKLDVLNSRTILIFVYVTTGVPFTLFYLYSFFQTLPRTFEEAAAIDGCSQIKTFWKIMLPLAQPGIVTVSIFNAIAIWNDFFNPLIFANKSSLRSLAVGVFSVVQSFLYAGDWPGMFTGVVFIFVPTLILYIFLSEKIVAGVSAGAVKG